MIFEPGRQVGTDIHESTSAVDVLPTLAHPAGPETPNWTEGVVLPPYAAIPPNRNVHVVQAIDNAPDAALTQASAVLVNENYKLHYYFGYPEVPDGELVKLFDIKPDPEELVDLYSSKKGIAMELLNQLKGKLTGLNKPYL